MYKIKPLTNYQIKEVFTVINQSGIIKKKMTIC